MADRNSFMHFLRPMIGTRFCLMPTTGHNQRMILSSVASVR